MWSQRAAIAAIAASAVLVVAGCGGSDGGGGADGSGPVTVPIVLDETGALGFAGVQARKGIEFAVKEANENDVLGGRKLEIDIQDSASDPKQGASLTTRLARDDDYSVMMVGPGGATSLASVPISNREKLPTAVLESGAPGIVETGEYIYRTSAPQEVFTGLMATHFKNEGVKTVQQVYNNDVPTNKKLAEDVWPKLAEENGFEITKSDGVALTATNFGTIASDIASKKPDAVMLHLAGAQYVSFISALRRTGYEGIVGGGQGASSGVLTPLGAQADGVFFVAEYSASTTDEAGKAFNEKIKAETGEDANLYVSSGYDSMNFIIKALENAGDDLSRENVLKAMAALAEEGTPDATTGPVTYENRDARIEGSLVEWRDGKDTIVEP